MVVDLLLLENEDKSPSEENKRERMVFLGYDRSSWLFGKFYNHETKGLTWQKKTSDSATIVEHLLVPDLDMVKPVQDGKQSGVWISDNLLERQISGGGKS